MTKSKVYVIETDWNHVEYQKTILICKTRQIAEYYLPFVQKQINHDCKTTLDIPLRITERTFKVKVE